MLCRLAPISRALFAALLFAAIPSDALAAKLKTLQRGTAQLGSGDTSKTAGITAVDLDKSILLFNLRGGSGTPKNAAVRAQLTANNTITFSRTESGNVIDLTWTVLEFATGVRVERGTANANNAAFGIDFQDAVDPSKSFVLATVSAKGGDNNWGRNDIVRAQLEDGDTIRLGYDNNDAIVVDWQVVEYQDAVVRRGTGTLANNLGTGSSPIGATVPLNKSLVLLTWFTDIDAGGEGFVRGQLNPSGSDATEVGVIRPVTGTQINYAWEVVTFTDNTTVQQGSLVFINDTTLTATFGSSVQTDRSVAMLSNLYGNHDDTGSDSITVNTFTTSLATDGLTLTRASNAAGSGVTWQAAQFEKVESVDLGIAQTDSPDPVIGGAQVAWTLTVTNHTATAPANNVVVTHTLPAGSTFVSATGAGWTCNHAAGVVTCTLPTLAASTAAAAITVTATAPLTGTLSSVATVRSDEIDPVPGNDSSTEGTAVTATANVGVTLQGAPDPVDASGDLVWTIAAANAGPADATNVTVVHTLPAGLTFKQDSGGDWTCIVTTDLNGSTSVTCTYGKDLLSGTSAEPLEITSIVPAEGGTVTSDVAISATEPDSSSANNTASDTVTVTPVADLGLSLAGDSASVVAGTAFSYELIASNDGPSTATAVAITFPVPSGTTYDSFTDGSGDWLCTLDSNTSIVTCTRASLASGASSTLNINVTVTAAGGSISASASIDGTEKDPVASNDAGNVSTTVTPGANLAISLVDSPDPVLAGQPLAWTVNVLNGGPSAAAGLSVVLTLPAGAGFSGFTGAGWSCANASGTVTCTAASLAASGATLFTVNGTAPAAAGQATASATVSATTADPVTANNTAATTTTVNGAANLGLAVVDSPDPVVSGGNVTYALTLNNAGPLAATSVHIDAALPAGTSFVSGTGSGWICGVNGSALQCVLSGSFAASASSALSVVLKAPTADGDFTTTFTAASAEGDPDGADNTASATTTVRSAELALSMGGPPTAFVGEDQSYSLTVTNNGPSAATSVKVQATLPAGTTFKSGSGNNWTCAEAAGSVTCSRSGTLSAGQSSSATVILAMPQAPGTVTLTGTASSAVADPNSANNTASTVTTVSPAADLSLTANATPAVVAAGGDVTYALTLANAGISPATGVTVTAPLPAGASFVSGTGTSWTCAAASGALTCTLTGPLAASGTSALTVVLKAPSADGQFTATFTAAATEHDPDALDNSVDASATVTSTDLSLAMVANPTSVLAGDDVTFDVTVTNGGPSAATAITVTLPVPTGLSYARETSTGWSCSASAGTVTCNRSGSLASGATSTVSVVFNGPNDPATINATASVAGAQIDPVAANNSASATANVAAAADLAIALTASPDPVPAGGALTLTAVITNNGPSTANGVAVSSPIPAGAAFVSGTGTNWTCAGATSPITCQLTGGIADGATSTVSIVLTAPPDGGTLNATASVTTTEVDQVGANDSASDSVQITPVADLAVAITASPNPVASGTDVGFTVTTTNNGPSTANGITVTVPVPAGASYVSGGSAGWTCAEANALVTCSRTSSLASGATSDVAFTLTAPTTTGPLAVTASADATEGDPAPANDSATANVTVAPAADLSLAATANQASVPARGEADVAFTVTNDGPNDATAVKVIAQLPADTSYVSAAGAGWTCAAANGEVTCDLAGALSATTTATVTVKLRATAQPGTFDVDAAVEAAEADLVPSNDTATATVTVTPVTDLSLQLAGAPATVARGGVTTFSATVGNAGPSTADGVEVSVTLGAGLTFKEVRGTGWTCNSTSPVVCTRAQLLPAESSTLQIDAVAPAVTGPVNAQAVVTGTHPDTDPANDTDQAVVQVGAPLLDNAQTALKVTPSGPASTGATLTYEVSVFNSGDLPAAQVEAAIAVPAGTRLAAGANHQQPFVIGDILPGESKTASFAVEIELDHPEQIEATAIVSAADLLPFERKVATPVSPDSPLTLTIVATPDTIEPGQESTLVFTASGGKLPSGGVLEVQLPASLELVAESTKIGSDAVPSTISDGKLLIELPAIGDEGLTSELKVLATASADGPQRITGILTREAKSRSLEASTELQIHTSYDIGGCGCGSSGESAAGAGLLALLAVVALGRRRPALQRVRAVRSRR